MKLKKLLKILMTTLLLVSFKLNGSEEKILSKQDQLSHYLTELVSFKTLSSDQATNAKALTWVEKQLDHLNLHFNHHQFAGHHALIITTQNTKKPKIWLVAHIDIVAGSEKLFQPVVKDQKMYGRGVYDMKMAIACYLLLMQELKDQLCNYDFGIMLTTDEEIGGMHGVKCLLEEGYLSDVALLPDGGFDWNFEESAKGVVHLKISSQGLSAHSSRPWNGENAIVKLMKALQDIKFYFDKEKSKNPTYYPTANIGIIQGGSAVNQVPDFAEAKIDVRFPPSMSSQQIYEEVKKITQQYPGVKTEKIIEGSPHQVNVESPYFQIFSHIAKEKYEIQVGLTKSHGASDARFFGERNIPVLVIAPKGGEIHSEDEWVDLIDLTKFYEVMKEWVIKTSSY